MKAASYRWIFVIKTFRKQRPYFTVTVDRKGYAPLVLLLTDDHINILKGPNKSGKCCKNVCEYDYLILGI